jgi:predicted DNA-binding transcriptional regulator YafY
MSKQNVPASTYKTVERLYFLSSALRNGLVSLQSLAEESEFYEVNKANAKKLQRDIGALSYCGFVIERYDSDGEYELISEPVQLDISEEEAELFATLRSVFPAGHPYHPLIESFMERFRSFLPPEMASLLDAPLPLQMALTPAIDYEPHRATLRRIQHALRRKVRIGFDYQGQDGIEEYRVVDPADLRDKNGHYYLRAYVPTVEGTLEFRIDRIPLESLRLFPARAAPRPQRMIEFSYHLGAKIAQRGVSKRFERQEVEQQADGSAIVHAEHPSPFRIIQELLRYGEVVELLEPEWLREQMVETVRKMANLYRICN